MGADFHEIDARWWNGQQPAPEEDFKLYVLEYNGAGPGYFYWVEHALVAAEHLWQYAREPVLYIASAASSGIVGNFAYDKLKSLWSQAEPELDFYDSSVSTIALLVVRARCAELNLPAPPFRSLKVIETVDVPGPRPGFWVIEVRGGDVLRASVKVPRDYRKTAGASVEVTLTIVSPP